MQEFAIMVLNPTGASSPIQAVVLNQENYRDYGDVVTARGDITPVSANMGTARRFNFTAKLENLRPGKAEPNLCFFRCSPQINAGQTLFQASVLERHFYSTQAFLPMAGADRFLVIVCLGKDRPDLSTFRAFLASKSQGITYKPGVWHHPLVAMDCQTDFGCLVWEDGSADDFELVKLERGVSISVPASGLSPD